MAEITVPMDDKELFQSAMADEPKQDPPAEVQPEPEQPRDDQGRFAPKSEPEPVKAEAKPVKTETIPEPIKDDQGGNVPSWRLREEREAREAATKRYEEAQREAYQNRLALQELQRRFEQSSKPKPEPVDFFQNPDEAFAQRLSPVQEDIQSFVSKMTLRTSRAEAISEFGKPAVAEMEAAIEKAAQNNHPDIPHLVAQMRSSDDPVGIAMRWYRQSALVERTGGDLDAYVQKQLDEKLKDPAFLAKAIELAKTQAGQTNSPSTIKLPPSLNRTTGSGVSNADPDDDDVSDAALFKHAMTSKRR